ncbi:restriction endonuclease subunit S [Pseudomonas stutzeri]|uniref:restriction endonuclease subunit S n=1 Tax=Stutzerimonas stutzeri TaxID=316 RepID=UPI002109F48C|nr:restriction endonuclease subunit S [Stutzerimonas stutzeri]MCQ4289336.1 restriction endonuclease subunit S [Stutzerimonas stutzeri]
MELKPGYKQTGVGVIPEDWDTPFLGDIVSSMQLGGNYKNDERQTDWPLIKMGNLGRGEIKLNRVEFINSAQTPAARDLLKKGDILFNTRNTLDLVGKVSIWRSELPEAYFNSNIARIEFDQRRVASKRYINYALNTPFFISTLRGIATGTTSVAAIYGRDLVKLHIPLPSPTEQRAIAKALCDADALIESLEQLLTKKRQIKQGAMQELLTGERRLPGFSGEWMDSSLLELAGGRKDLFDDGDWIESEHITSDGIRLVQTGNIGIGKYLDKPERKYIYETSFASLRCKEVVEGDLLICRLAEPAGRACLLPNIGEEKIVTSVDVTIFRPPQSAVDRAFLVNLLSMPCWFQAVSDRSGGTTHKRISRGALGRIRIKLPALNEQSAIASVLSAMDNEITSLETQLQKARLIKQGMMQELLTGRIRLV